MARFILLCVVRVTKEAPVGQKRSGHQRMANCGRQRRPRTRNAQKYEPGLILEDVPKERSRGRGAGRGERRRKKETPLKEFFDESQRLYALTSYWGTAGQFIALSETHRITLNAVYK